MRAHESKGFLKVLGFLALSWAGLGIALFYREPGALGVFFQIFWATILDLSFLILLFWQLFFAPKPLQKFRVFVYFTFKLVCLGFLAITLKRLRNEPPLPAGLAVLFMGIGPLLSAIISKKRLRSE